MTNVKMVTNTHGNSTFVVDKDASPLRPYVHEVLARIAAAAEQMERQEFAELEVDVQWREGDDIGVFDAQTGNDLEPHRVEGLASAIVLVLARRAMLATEKEFTDVLDELVAEDPTLDRPMLPPGVEVREATDLEQIVSLRQTLERMNKGVNASVLHEAIAHLEQRAAAAARAMVDQIGVRKEEPNRLGGSPKPGEEP